MVELKTQSQSQIWHNGLKAKGVVWVKDELRRRPGQPDDVLEDVVYQEPHPTREFCRQWCIEQDNKIVGLSGYSLAVVITSIVLLAFLVKALIAWNTLPVIRDQRAHAAQHYSE